jgi:hypothetical protein
LINELYNKEPFCSPPWNIGDGPIADRLDVKVENAWQYLTQTQPGSNTAEADFGDDIPDIPDIPDDIPTGYTRAQAHKARRMTARNRRAGQWSK